MEHSLDYFQAPNKENIAVKNRGFISGYTVYMDHVPIEKNLTEKAALRLANLLVSHLYQSIE